jgi:hypothetical protein
MQVARHARSPLLKLVTCNLQPKTWIQMGQIVKEWKKIVIVLQNWEKVHYPHILKNQRFSLVKRLLNYPLLLTGMFLALIS